MRKDAARTVLVVDDNEVNRTVLLRQLERLGYEATAASGGVQALEAVAGSPFALVLMDCRMPGMDGLEATRRIREAEAGTGWRIPIVAVTANAMEADREACFAAGMDDFLAKPVMLDGLRAILDRLVPDEEAVAEPAPRPPSSPGANRGETEGEDPSDPLLRMYLAELPGRVGAIRQAVGAGDPGALALAAHTLRSTSALVGATRLAQLCGDLEAAGRAGVAGGVADRLPLLDAESAAARWTLEGGAARTAG